MKLVIALIQKLFFLYFTTSRMWVCVCPVVFFLLGTQSSFGNSAGLLHPRGQSIWALYLEKLMKCFYLKSGLNVQFSGQLGFICYSEIPNKYGLSSSNFFKKDVQNLDFPTNCWMRRGTSLMLLSFIKSSKRKTISPLFFTYNLWFIGTR